MLTHATSSPGPGRTGRLSSCCGSTWGDSGHLWNLVVSLPVSDVEESEEGGLPVTACGH